MHHQMDTPTTHFARVVVDVAVDRAFDYIIPNQYNDQIQIGSRVSVPFGPRYVQGYVIERITQTTAKAPKPIAKRIGLTSPQGWILLDPQEISRERPRRPRG